MPRSSGPPLRLLIADDEPEIRELLREYLSARGHAVEVAADGRAALERLQASVFDVVLTDVRMPVMGGDDLVSAIRDADLSVGVVVMTGFPTIQTATRALTLGASDYLLKPFRLRDIHDALLRAASRSRLEQRVARAEASLALHELALRRAPLLASPEALWSALSIAARTEVGASAFALWQPQPTGSGGDAVDWVQVAGHEPTAALLHLEPARIEVPWLEGRLAAVPVGMGLERLAVFAVDGGDVRTTAQVERLEILARPLAFALMQRQPAGMR